MLVAWDKSLALPWPHSAHLGTSQRDSGIWATLLLMEHKTARVLKVRQPGPSEPQRAGQVRGEGSKPWQSLGLGVGHRPVQPTCPSQEQRRPNPAGKKLRSSDWTFILRTRKPTDAGKGREAQGLCRAGPHLPALLTAYGSPSSEFQPPGKRDPRAAGGAGRISSWSLRALWHPRP